MNRPFVLVIEMQLPCCSCELDVGIQVTPMLHTHDISYLWGKEYLCPTSILEKRSILSFLAHATEFVV